MWCSSWSSRHLRHFKSSLVVAQQSPTSLGRLAPFQIHKSTRILASLTNLDNFLQLGFTNLRSWKVQLSSFADLLRILEFLDLSISCCNEFRLVRSVTTVLSVFTLPLSFFPLSFLFCRLTLVLETTEGVADGSDLCASVLIRCVVESSCRLLFEWNVCVVLVGIQSDMCPV